VEALVTAGDGNQRGQAALFTRGGACFALTPKHVLGSGNYATLLIPNGRKGARQAQGDVCAEWGELDLSVLRVTGNSLNSCGDPLATATPIEKLLPDGGAGALRYANENGSTEWMDVIVTFRGQNNYVGIRPRSTREQLKKGLSGSTLYLSNLPAGLLLSTTHDAILEGEVLRLDYIVTLLNTLFETRNGPSAHGTSCYPAERHLSKSNTAARIDFASAESGGEVVHWSAPPISPEHRPDRLIAPHHSGGYWAVRSNTPVFVVVRLAEVRTISRIDLDFTDVSPGERPASGQVLTRASEDGPWTNVTGFHLSSMDTSRTLAFAPRTVREIRVEITANSRNQQNIGIGRILAFN
jgi:hypothetical protein